MNTDDDLAVGEFGNRNADGPAGARRRRARAGGRPGATMVYRPQAVPQTEAVSPEELGVEPEVVTLTVDGTEHAIDKQSVVIGRSKDCDIRLADPNASRRHAEVRQEGTAYWLVDLDSTNGTTVNGRRQQRAKLESDDRITIGSTELVFRRGR